MKEYKLPLATEKDVAWEARHKSIITVKYVFDFPLDLVLRLIDIFQGEVSAICCLASAILASIHRAIRHRRHEGHLSSRDDLDARFARLDPLS